MRIPLVNAMWILKNARPISRQFFGEFQPIDTFAVYDKTPMVFTVKNTYGMSMLAIISAWEDRSYLLRFLVVPIDQDLIESLSSNVISLRTVLNQPWLWVVDLDYTWKVSLAHMMSFNDLPASALPAEDTTIYLQGA